MIGKKWKYKGLEMSDDIALTNRFVITDFNKNLTYRTVIRDKQNYHGSNATPTLASGRLFTFSFTIFGDRLERAQGQRLLEAVMIPEFSPGKTTGLYTLTWETDSGEEVKSQAGVYGGVRYETMAPGSMFINGTFELYAPDPIYQGLTTKSNAGEYGRNGGCELETELGVSLSDVIAEVTFENTGNWTAPCKIEVKGSILNPKIKNLSNDTFYGLTRTTTDLLIDGTGTRLIVTDEGVNVKADRMPGSEILRVQPGENTFLLTGDDFSFDSTVEWILYFNDTFL